MKKNCTSIKVCFFELTRKNEQKKIIKNKKDIINRVIYLLNDLSYSFRTNFICKQLSNNIIIFHEYYIFIYSSIRFPYFCSLNYFSKIR